MNGGDKSLKECVISLQSEISTISSKLDTFNSIKSQVDKNTEEINKMKKDFDIDAVCNELRLRDVKACNLIMYGVVENDSEAEEKDSVSADITKVKDILSVYKIDKKKVVTRRFGTPVDNNPRPIRVTLTSKIDVMKVLRNKDKLSKEIKVYSDRTFIQRIKIKTLNNEIKNYNMKNPT